MEATMSEGVPSGNTIVLSTSIEATPNHMDVNTPQGEGGTSGDIVLLTNISNYEILANCEGATGQEHAKKKRLWCCKEIPGGVGREASMGGRRLLCIGVADNYTMQSMYYHWEEAEVEFTKQS